MSPTKQAFSIFSVLMLLAFSGWYFAKSNDTTQLDDQYLSRTTDTTIDQLVVRRFDEEGHLIHYLKTPRLEHTPFQDTYLIQNPHIIFNQPKQPTWEINSEQAKATEKEKIIFSHHVIAHQHSSPSHPESIIKTEELSYFFKEQLAISTLPVRFEQPGTVVNSQGLKAYFAQQRIQLLKAQATYDPKHNT